MVRISDNTDLISAFTGLPGATAFVYGDANRSLSYLPTVARTGGVACIEVPPCGHFPMYSNQPAMWAAIEATIRRGER